MQKNQKMAQLMSSKSVRGSFVTSGIEKWEKKVHDFMFLLKYFSYYEQKFDL